MTANSARGLKQLAMSKILESRGMTVRDVDGGEEPFLYSSGNHGPGYIDIKGRVGWDEAFEPLVLLLVVQLIDDGVTDMDLIVGMMTGGALPGHRLKQLMQTLLGRRITYIYQRGARKVGGHGELDTGDRDNEHIPPGCRTLVVEELVNFAVTTCNGVQYERGKGRDVRHAGAILSYENPVAIRRLRDNDITLHYPISLVELIEFAVVKGFTTKRCATQYMDFLEDPKKWNEDHGFTFYGGDE
jgi:orotate phosphoribosyltransferase